jgi:hypothetical protein
MLRGVIVICPFMFHKKKKLIFDLQVQHEKIKINCLEFAAKQDYYEACLKML